jgi:hypothetical protein
MVFRNCVAGQNFGDMAVGPPPINLGEFGTVRFAEYDLDHPVWTTLLNGSPPL